VDYRENKVKTAESGDNSKCLTEGITPLIYQLANYFNGSVTVNAVPGEDLDPSFEGLLTLISPL
jgi:hypothetical protein